ncbi:MAG: hypothetical protein H6573_20185 [Lewinellaceae bacterium]|nr:hypothetical protein [Lewinellaceae bacterium]
MAAGYGGQEAGLQAILCRIGKGLHTQPGALAVEQHADGGPLFLAKLRLAEKKAQ